MESVGGFISKKDAKNILFKTWSDDKFKKLLKELIEHNLIYQDRNYNGNILLTAKALSILKEKYVKNKVNADKITDITLDKNRFILTIKHDFGYIENKNFEEDFIHLYIEHFIEKLEKDIKNVTNLKERLDKENVLLVDLDTIAIQNIISITTLKHKLEKLESLDRYSLHIKKIILNKFYIKEITDKNLNELEKVTKKYTSTYSDTIEYILI